MRHCKSQSKLINFLLFGFFAAFFFNPNVLAQQGKRIEVLDIIGNRRLTDVEILRHIKTRPGERFDQKQAQEDLQALLKLDLFDKSRLRVFTEVGVRGGAHVIFEVRELPLIVELNFDGLRYVSKEELLEELRYRKVEVKADTPYQPEKLRKAWRVIIEYLVEKRGFTDAKVEVREEEVSATTLIVSFVIDEMTNDDEEDCCEK